MPVWTRLALVTALTAVALTLLAKFIRCGRPAALDGVSGTITPEKISAGVTVVVGAGMAVAGGWAVLTHHGDWGVVTVAGMGVAIAGAHGSITVTSLPSNPPLSRVTTLAP